MREPVFYLILISALVLIGLFPTCAMFVFRKQIKLVVDSAMATTMFFGLFVAVLCAGHTISREMKNGTVLLLLSKPVTRLSFILAKVLGIMAAISVFVLVSNCATIISVLIARDQFQLDYTSMGIYFGLLAAASIYGGVRNYLSQASFSSHAVMGLTATLPLMAIVLYAIRYSGLGDHGIDPEEFMEAGQLIPALLLLFPAVWAMGAITVALATRLEFVANLVVCMLVFLFGLVSQYLVGQWFGDGIPASILKAVFPNWQYFWMADALSNLQPIPYSYVICSILYVLIYILIWTSWALFLFNDREVARDSR